MANGFQWSSENLACVATYNVLENDSMLDQFEDIDLAFEPAGETLLSTLPYYPKFGASDAQRIGLGHQMARRFLRFIVKNYTDRKEHAADSVEEILTELARRFAGDKSRLIDLAEVTDRFLRFDNE